MSPETSHHSWVPDGPGTLTITECKAYFTNPAVRSILEWGGLDPIDLVGPDVFETSFRNHQDGRPVTLRLHTPWASLLFVLAARYAFTSHPRLLGGGWLPSDFEERCARAGRRFRPADRLAIGQ